FDMAVDEALAEAVGAGDSLPVVRLYGFSPPTLSLGRFQKIKGRYSPSLLAEDGVTLVRRPTGGHAVLHDCELTYSVALSKEGSGTLIGGARKREVYEFVARVLLAGLAELGITGRINASRQGDLHNPDCFGSSGEYEIAGRDGRKLIGSAQMTTRRAVLQHGSIPLENPGRRVLRYIKVDEPLDSGDPTCLNEETGRILSFEEVQEAFARAFQLNLHAERSELRDEEKKAADRILAARYASDSWNLAY
ncbi:MAG: biotin/lipoate A/B protein ligase family protein, partial [Spirochaetia bacterium]